MCGRFTLSTPAEQLAQAFNVSVPPTLLPRYNIAPTQLIAVVANKADGNRIITQLPWGMVQKEAQGSKKGLRRSNVRAELVACTLGVCFREKRCMIPADGFFDWRTVGRRKYAHYFSRSDGEPFAFAGIWDLWIGENQKLMAACVITTSANDLVRPVSHRMPAILSRESYAEWLDPETPVDRLLSILKPYPTEAMVAKEVGPAVNSPRNDGPECVQAT